MKVLFIGGTGIISEAVSRLAIERGHDLYLFNRGKRDELVPEGAKIIQGDIRDPEAAASLLAEHQFDSVVDWISYTPDQVQTSIKLFKGRTAQYVYISSASAYQKPPEHYIITEETPLTNPYWQYSRDKIACEELLAEEHEQSGFPYTIVRPSFTYGNTMIPASISSWQHPWTLVDRMRQGKKIIIHGDGTSLWTMTHNTDFAVGFLGLLGHPEAIGEAFHITSDEVISWNQLYASIAAAAGAELSAVHISSDFLCTYSPDLIGGLLGDKAVSSVFDNSKIKRLVPEFNAKLSFAEGIRRSVEWFEARPEKCTIDAEWNNWSDTVIAAYEKGFNRS